MLRIVLPEKAEAVLRFRAAPELQARIEELAGKSTEGELTDAEIEAYLLAETPYDCTGSAKSEGMGIALLESIDNDDPSALVGLPLIRTCRMIRAAGIKVL